MQRAGPRKNFSKSSIIDISINSRWSLRQISAWMILKHAFARVSQIEDWYQRFGSMRLIIDVPWMIPGILSFLRLPSWEVRPLALLKTVLVMAYHPRRRSHYKRY